MIKRVLVALSGSPFTPSAVEHAVELAQRHGSEVTGVTLVDVKRLEDVGPVPIGGMAAAHALAEHRLELTEARIEEEVGRFEACCANADTPAHVARETGNALDELTDLWRYHDLTVIGLRGLFEYGVVDNPDDQVGKLLARGVRPIIAVAKEHREIRRALIAYNGSMESAKAMKRFVQMRLWPDAELEIVCFEQSIDEGKSLIADAAAYCRAHGYEATTHYDPGSPKDQMFGLADKRNVDIIVMGASPRGKLSKLILGDTAKFAIMHSELPLFLAQ